MRIARARGRNNCRSPLRVFGEVSMISVRTRSASDSKQDYKTTDHRPRINIEHRTSNIQHPTPNTQHPTSNTEPQTPDAVGLGVGHPESSIQHRGSSIPPIRTQATINHQPSTLISVVCPLTSSSIHEVSKLPTAIHPPDTGTITIVV